MKENQHTSVREIKIIDLELLVDYWFSSDTEFFKRMGADKDKLPTRTRMKQMITQQIRSPIKDKKSYALIWELNGIQIGHSNVNNIIYGNEATMHLHLWNYNHRKKGIGTEFVKKSLPFYFENLRLNRLICEPYSLNPAPNRTIEKVGFKFIKKYKTVPGSICFEQEVNRWELTKENFEKITLLNNTNN